MIVRSITVENWRCYLNPLTVGPFDERLNVIHAPNATGKSTLFEALRRALMDGHRVTGEAVEAIRPWGRDLAPRVTVEFSHDGAEYRITKRFLRNQESVLERKEKGRFVRWKEGPGADEWVRSLLSKNPPGRGLSRAENWGLGQILWAPQGALSLVGLSGDLVNDIRASLGAQLAHPGSGALEKRIEELYGQVFTSTGKYRTGRDEAMVVRLQNRLKEIRDRLQGARERLLKFEEISRKIEELRQRRTQAEREAEGLSKILQSARSKADEYRALLSEEAQRRKEVEESQKQYEDLKERIDRIQTARKELAEAQQQIRVLEEKIPTVEREIETWQRESAQARAAWEDIRRGRGDVDKRQTMAEEARAFVENEKKLSDLRQRLKSIQAAQQALEELERQQAALLAPDARTLKKIREALSAREEALRNIRAALITLEIVPDRETTAEVIEGEPPGSRTVPRGTPLQVQGSPQVVVHLPGVARLRAWGPAQSIEQHRKDLADADRDLRKLIEPFGTENVEELEQRHEEAKELEKKVSNRRTEIETLSAGRPVPDLIRELSREISQGEGFRQATLARYPEWQNALPDAEALSRAAKDAYRGFLEKEREAKEAYELAQKALRKAEEAKTEINEKIHAQKIRIAGSEKLLEALTSDGKTDEDRDQRLKGLALEWDAARFKLDTVKQRLSEFESDPISSVEKLERQLEAFQQSADEARDQAKIEEGRLHELAAEGPYSEVARLEEEAADLERQAQEEELRAKAIRLLHEIVNESRAEVQAAVTGPVERAATRMLHRIAGERLGTLKIGAGFQPERICPGENLEASLDNASGGEQEQIHLVTRLALAEVLAKEQRQLVVWDDVLAATDMGRLARTLTLIEEAAERLQIVILTCHPERYRGLERARFIDLEALVRGTEQA